MLNDDPIISKVLLRYKYFPKRPDYVEPTPRIPLVMGTKEEENISTFTKLWVSIKLLPYLYKLIIGLSVKNWKTTISAGVGAIAMLVNAFTGVTIPQEAIVGIALFLVGLFAKDGNN